MPSMIPTFTKRLLVSLSFVDFLDGSIEASSGGGGGWGEELGGDGGGGGLFGSGGLSGSPIEVGSGGAVG